MEFYKSIARYYDQIFPVNQKQVDFIRNGHIQFKVLDIACGNGGYLNRLSEYGFYGYGIDLDHNMINIANSKKTSDKVDFYEMNMTEIESFKEQSFDLIYSIGNSIVHLNTLEEIKKFVLSAFYLLKPRGEFILQIVNYDRILDKQVSSLPTISNANLTMTREYTLHQGKILFKTLLDVEGFAYENEVKLLPLRSDELISILLEAGFARYEQYGDFVGSSFNRLESMSLVIKAFK